MKLKAILQLCLLLLPALTAPALAQSDSRRIPTPTANAPAAGMEAVIVDVKHKDPSQIVDVVRFLASERGVVNSNRELRTIVIRDFPENIATIKAAIARLDVAETRNPLPVQDNYEVQLYLIATSRTSADKTDLPEGLGPVITQMKETLKYQGYRYITTFLNRVQNYENVNASGITSPIFPIATDTGKSFYKYRYTLQSATDASGRESIRLQNFSFNVSIPLPTPVVGAGTSFQYTDVGINTSVVLHEGEKVVVGTANLGSSDEAVIVVVSARKIK
ncbi:MAG TPA: hypothetical protein VFD58_09395 [Blastocatellia bacterium]|nr:hypothetical protein [Blastocatellia bacterium]